MHKYLLLQYYTILPDMYTDIHNHLKVYISTHTHIHIYVRVYICLYYFTIGNYCFVNCGLMQLKCTKF